VLEFLDLLTAQAETAPPARCTVEPSAGTAAGTTASNKAVRAAKQGATPAVARPRRAKAALAGQAAPAASKDSGRRAAPTGGNASNPLRSFLTIAACALPGVVGTAVVGRLRGQAELVLLSMLTGLGLTLLLLWHFIGRMATKS
jgi:hypothetical protein